MKTINGRLNNVCFKHKKSVQRANRVVRITRLEEKFWSIFLDGRQCGYELETNDVLYFIPLASFSNISKDLKLDFLADIREKWIKCGFQIVEETEIPGGTYFHVSYDSLCFRLKYIGQ